MANKKALQNWRDFKFGMFIHYGVYSVIGKGEWALFHKKIDKDDYTEIAENQFKAENFDADYIVNLAKKAGMKYAVFTARHHDGFSLFDSKHSIGDFTVMHTPCKRDLVLEFTDACHKHGVATGIYYSPIDWRCEGFFLPFMYQRSARALRTQCQEQIRELMTGYGKVDILWYDGGEDYMLGQGVHVHEKPAWTEDFRQHPMIHDFWGEDALNELAVSNHPDIIVNNRIGTRKYGDYVTPERVVGAFDVNTPWETCDTLSESWGWMPNTKVRSVKEVIHLLISVITGGGNLLLNISPLGDGSVDPAHATVLLNVGKWLEQYGEAVYGTRGGPVKNHPDFGGAVNKANNLYFHIKDKACTKFRLPVPADSKITNICALTGEQITYEISDSILTVTLPEQERADIATVVRISFNKDVKDLFDGFDAESFDAFAL